MPQSPQTSVSWQLRQQPSSSLTEELRTARVTPPDRSWVQLNPRVGQIISILCLIIGTYALLKFGYGAATVARARGIARVDIGRLEESSYPITIAGFAVQGALIQCAMRGFTRWRVVLLAILIALSSINLVRSAFVLAAAMSFLFYQSHRNKSDLPVKWLLGVPLLGLMWFVFKPVSAAVNDNESVSQILASAETTYRTRSVAGH